MTLLSLYISHWWCQTWDMCLYSMVVSQSEVRVGTKHEINTNWSCDSLCQGSLYCEKLHPVLDQKVWIFYFSGECWLVAINSGPIILAPSHAVKSLLLSWRYYTHIFHLQEPKLQFDLETGHQDSGPSHGHWDGITYCTKDVYKQIRDSKYVMISYKLWSHSASEMKCNE